MQIHLTAGEHCDCPPVCVVSSKLCQAFTPCTSLLPSAALREEEQVHLGQNQHTEPQPVPRQWVLLNEHLISLFPPANTPTPHLPHNHNNCELDLALLQHSHYITLASITPDSTGTVRSCAFSFCYMQYVCCCTLMSAANLLHFGIYIYLDFCFILVYVRVLLGQFCKDAWPLSRCFSTMKKYWIQ